MLGSCIRLIWCHFYSCFLSNWLLAEKFSNCSNSLNFEAKINCNTTEPNVPKWRKTCTGLQFDIVHFNGPQSHILFVGNLWGPCSMFAFHWIESPIDIISGQCRTSVNILGWLNLEFRGWGGWCGGQTVRDRWATESLARSKGTLLWPLNLQCLHHSKLFQNF